MAASSLLHAARGIQRPIRKQAVDATNPLLWLIIIASLSSLFTLHSNHVKKITGAPCSSRQHTESKGNIANTYMQIPLPNTSLPSFSFAACCGIGHRLSFNIPAAVYATSNLRVVHANWGDIKWNVLFNDTRQIIQGSLAEENFENTVPPGRWWALAWTETMEEKWSNGWSNQLPSTSYGYYSEDMKILMELPLGQAIVKTLAQNLSPLVLSFLTPMRGQSIDSDLHLCTHVREGNSETGDWKAKRWRHFDLFPVLNSTLVHMDMFARSRNATKVSVFVASDNKKAFSWFEENISANWNMVKPVRTLSRPETGVWFGEWGSNTNANMTQQEKEEAMAEAVADVFALGECDALFVPNYSSFNLVGIMLTRAERKKVFFQGGLNWREYPESINMT